MDGRSRSPMRFVAPLALIAAAVVFLAVLAGGIGGGDEQPTGTEAARESQRGSGAGGGSRSTPDTYEVQDGDTLDAIAAETGVSVEEIEELNPDLDPQSLIAGQELQLTE